MSSLYRAQAEKQINCPQCGDALSLYFKWTKLVACRSCKSTIFLEDDGSLKIGESSTLSPEPSLIELHDPIEIAGKVYTPLGKIRYGYGRGFWEEWFLTDREGGAFWLSVDEGDFVLEKKLKVDLPFENPLSAVVGKRYNQYVVTERGNGTCVGFEGELPEPIKVGKMHFYLHLTRGNGHLLTVEVQGNNVQTFVGEWIDPFTIKKVYG